MKYKIAETFYSLQGEGYFTGTPMLFVRMSQCPVGKTEGVCQTWLGKPFICDTGKSYKPRTSVEFHDYTQVNQELTAHEIWKLLPPQCHHLCITGGEPLIYPIVNLVLANKHQHMLHVETSGTIYQHLDEDVWVTVSPKLGVTRGMSDRANEFKLLVDRTTTKEDLQMWVTPRPVYLQPIEDGDWVANRKHAVELALELGMRVSLQTHKLLEIR